MGNIARAETSTWKSDMKYTLGAVNNSVIKPNEKKGEKGEGLYAINLA